MDHQHGQTGGDGIKRTPVHEGPRNHFIAFAISIVLTLFAFITVANTSFSKAAIYGLILLMAVVQAAVQLLVWMHMKDRGHTFARMAIIFGAIVVITIMGMALYWVWW